MALLWSTCVSVLVLLYDFCSAETGKVTEYHNESTKMLSVRDACTLVNTTDTIQCEKDRVTLRVKTCVTFGESSNTLTLA